MEICQGEIRHQLSRGPATGWMDGWMGGWLDGWMVVGGGDRSSSFNSASARGDLATHGLGPKGRVGEDCAPVEEAAAEEQGTTWGIPRLHLVVRMQHIWYGCNTRRLLVPFERGEIGQQLSGGPATGKQIVAPRDLGKFVILNYCRSAGLSPERSCNYKNSDTTDSDTMRNCKIPPEARVTTWLRATIIPVPQPPTFFHLVVKSDPTKFKFPN